MDEYKHKKEELMNLLVQHSNADMDDEFQLANELLTLWEAHKDTHAIAFAHTFLADYHLMIREHEACLKHLHIALNLGEEYHYTDLLLRNYTIAGLYYNSHFDEVNAIQNLLNAYNLAENEKDLHQKMVVLNNIATMFFQKEDYQEALYYIKMAYQTFLDKKATIMTHADLLVILNLIQLEIFNEHLDKAIKRYQEYAAKLVSFKASPLSTHVIRLCELYLANASKRVDSVKRIADYFSESNLHKHKNRTYYFTFYCDIFAILLQIKDQERAEKYLQYMGEMCLEDDVEQQLQLHRNWIRYAECFHLENVLINSYKQYYMLQKLVEDMTNKTKSESMKEKIKMNQIMKERDRFRNEKNQLEAQIKIDGLTRLFNRSYFNSLVCAMHKNPHVSTIGIVVADVDYFKEFNDYYGHHMGDKLLQNVARCMDENGDSRFFAARFGGDEFITLCVNITKEDICEYLDHIYEELDQIGMEHKMNKAAEKATISCGFTIFQNDDLFRYEDALTMADAALYKAKAAGKNQYKQY